MSKFQGFNLPEENWSKLPHQLIESLSKFASQGELMVVLYILRHTWGFQEFDQFKKITLNEFMHGRKTTNLKEYPTGRMDKGVGMSKGAIIRGLQRAEEHGFIKVEKDERDKARVKKYYMLNMVGDDTLDVVSQNGTPKSSVGVPKENPDVPKEDTWGSKVEHRSEKDTLERNNDKETDLSGNEEDSPSDSSSSRFDVDGGIIDIPEQRRRYIPSCEYEHEDGTIEVIEDDSWQQEMKQLDYQILTSAGLEEYPDKKYWKKAQRVEKKLARGEISGDYIENRCWCAANHPWGLDKLLNSLLNPHHYRNWQEREAARERKKTNNEQ